MTDRPKTTETPIERALRLKQAALKSKPQLPGGGKFQPKQTAGMPSGASKPAMRK